MVQDDANNQDAGVHQEGGTWVALKDAAALLDVSVDTVKRRMQRGELESRRETIPQGFRWLVRVDPLISEAVESPVTNESDHRELALPSAESETVAILRHQLEVRNREIAELHATLATLARALEQQSAIPGNVGERAPHEETVPEAPESTETNETGRLSILGWLRRLLSS